jgi:chemotaxis protein CheY-P-specific phosphatase CheC
MHDRKEIIYHVLEEILENLSFLFFSPEDTRDTMDYETAVAAKISFTGLFSGTLALALSHQVLPEITRNMLGVEEEIIFVPQQHDAVKELLNVICGNVLPAIAGKREIFFIGVPDIISPEEMMSSALRCPPTSMIKGELDNGQIDLFLLIDSEEIPEA